MLYLAGMCKNSTVHLEDRRVKTTPYMCEVFTHYNLISVSSSITHHLLFVHIPAKIRILRKFIKLSGFYFFSEHTKHPCSIPAVFLNSCMLWDGPFPDCSLCWELLQFPN